MSLTTKILLGLLGGVAVGLFLGELAAPLSIGGDVFIGLLQMTVLPYIVVSLVSNLGRVSWEESRDLMRTAIAVLGGLILIGVLILAVSPLAFPPWKAASFFSSSLVEVPEALDLVALYIPANPFASLANNVVPAVVLFSIFVGVGLSGLPGNGGLLRGLEVLAAALNQVNKLVVRATPVGVFAIAAATAGTMSIDDIGRLQTYVVTYTLLAAVVAFGVLPILVSSVTPFSYRQVATFARDTLLTIFATGKIIVVLPQLTEDVKDLFRRNQLGDDAVESGADVLMPLAYPFPNLGTYVIFLFVPFAAWFLGREMELSELAVFQGATLLSSFVAPIIGIPFLLDLMGIPADMMELFVVSTVYTDRIRVVLGAMHLVSLTIVVLAVRRGVAEVRGRRCLVAAAVCVGLVLTAVVAARAYLGRSLDGSYSADQAIVRMHSTNAVPAPSVGSEPVVAPRLDGSSRLLTVRERGALRVGYLPDSLPFAFRNVEGEVVGFDIELAQHLAADLGVALEVFRIEPDSISRRFESGQVDIVMSGLAMTPERIARWDVSTSPLDLRLAFLVQDNRRRDFDRLAAVRSQKGLRLGVVQSDPAIRRLIASHFPGAAVETIASPRKFLRGLEPELDAVVYSAEAGSAWTLIYPDYTVAVPLPLVLAVPAAYPLPKGDAAWTDYVSRWIELKKKDGTIDRLFEHWILGEGALAREPRWSIVRDVLGWVE